MVKGIISGILLLILGGLGTTLVTGLMQGTRGEVHIEQADSFHLEVKEELKLISKEFRKQRELDHKRDLLLNTISMQITIIENNTK